MYERILVCTDGSELSAHAVTHALNLAKTSGARKVIALIHRFEFMRLVTKVGIDAAVSPRLSTVNAILHAGATPVLAPVAGL